MYILGGYRGKRGSWIPVPPLTTGKPYHTALGHPDISWYLGHDPDVKKEDVEQLAENTSSNVEVLYKYACNKLTLMFIFKLRYGHRNRY